MHMSRSANCRPFQECAEIANVQIAWRRLCLGMLLVLAAGCGKSGPEVAPVKGRVTLDGRPLEMATWCSNQTNGEPPSDIADRRGRALSS